MPIGRCLSAVVAIALAAGRVDAGIATPTLTFTETALPTLTATPSVTPSSTATRTPTATPTRTATRTGTRTVTASVTLTATASPIPSATGTHTATATPTRTRTFTATALPTASNTRTVTATFTATLPFTQTATPTPTATNTADPRPAISISDVLAPEGLVGTRLFNFIVLLSKRSTQTVTVRVTTANGTATAGSDYVAVSQTLQFAPSQMSMTVSVRVNGDATNEPVETFFVNLSAPINAVIADNQGRGIITNDDVGVSSLSPRNGSVAAGERIALTLGWTHPERWRLLDTLDLRLRAGDQVIGWVRFSETPNTFAAVDPANGEAGPGFAPHSDGELTSAVSTVFLHDSGWVESANHERVDVTWQFAFDPTAAGQVYVVEAAATDDDGFAQGFESVGTLAIGSVCGGDCGADGGVAVSELIVAVRIALGELPLEGCLAADADRDEAISISDLVGAVDHALTGCPLSE